jgi:hypothetical protein
MLINPPTCWGRKSGNCVVRRNPPKLSSVRASILYRPNKWLALNCSVISRYKPFFLCRNFKEKGTCLYGDLCQFAHGRHELRVRYSCTKSINRLYSGPCFFVTELFLKACTGGGGGGGCQDCIARMTNCTVCSIGINRGVQSCTVQVPGQQVHRLCPFTCLPILNYTARCSLPRSNVCKSLVSMKIDFLSFHPDY